MMAYSSVVIFLILVSCTQQLLSIKYEPNWDSLDSRPNPAWYDEAKFGIFMHWGVYSVPSYKSAWFWRYWHDGQADYVNFMKNNYPPGFSYADFAPMFHAEMFNPDEWADLLSKSGAKYLLLTSKHHEGWANWRSNVSWNWNSVDNGPHRDLVGDLAKAIRSRTDIKFGLYHSLYEWFNPLYLEDKGNAFKTQKYVKEVLQPQLHDIVNSYKPDVIWSDGDWDASAEYWDSLNFLTWLFNESPVKDMVAVNDRWGKDCMCRHGGYFTCRDRYNPGVLQKFKWENDMTLDKKAWVHRRDAVESDFFTVHELIEILAETVSCGGNMVLNIGPTADGRIIPIFQERLMQMGKWLGTNGEGIYGTKPWRVQNETNVWYTSKPGAVYTILLQWPANGMLQLRAPIVSDTTSVEMLGLQQKISWVHMPENKGLIIRMPLVPPPLLPSEWSWVFKLTNVA